ALRRHPDPESADVLLEIAKRHRVHVGSAALNALGNPVYRESLPQIAELLQHKELQGYAASVMMQIDPQAAVKSFFDELEAGRDAEGMLYQHLQRHTGVRLEQTPAAWLKWRTTQLANEPISAAASPQDHSPQIVWGPDRKGLQAGAKIIGHSTQLQPGDPLVIQILLKNTSNDVKTVVLQRPDQTYPTLGANQRLELNVIGSSQNRQQHELAAGEVLNSPQYRVTISTVGLPDGEYHATANTILWQANDNGGGTGIPLGKPIPFTLGDPTSVQFAKPPATLPDGQQISWGAPVAGLVLGARFSDENAEFTTRSRVAPVQYLCNLSGQTVEVNVEIPADPGDWNLHLTQNDPEKSYVQLNSVSYSGMRLQRYRRLTLKSGDVQQLTGVKAPILTGRSAANAQSEETEIPGPVIQVLPEKEEFKPGDPKQLITSAGRYIFHSAVTVRQPQMSDVTLVISAGEL
ncbi:MAG: hypothetical protein KDA96_27670, partial [Planctomycetaceae bacterium]|nr:hypothetical protein [Planctomycetaceae bacterium]